MVRTHPNTTVPILVLLHRQIVPWSSMVIELQPVNG
jgi:hypothetical protein